MATEKRRIWRVTDTQGNTVQVLPETSAEQVTIADAGNKFTSKNVEGALQELATGVANAGKVDDVQDVNGTSIVTNKIAKLSKAAVGLGNVDNTADKDKRVAYAAEAGKVTNALEIIAHNGPAGTRTVSFDGSLDPQVDFDVNDFNAESIEKGMKISLVDKGYATKTYVDTQDDKKLDKTGGTITGDLAVNGGVTIGGNLTVSGTTTTVDSTTLQVKDKLIEVAHGNTEKLTTPAGIVAPKYDGTKSGALVFNGDGIASVGDVVLDASGNIDVAQSNLQPLATRTGLVNDNLVKYDGTNQTLVDTGKTISDFATAAQGETADAAKAKADANATEISNIKDGTTVVKNAEHANAADNATNVTTNINGHAITSIFETDGITAKNATHASSADTANVATKVAHGLTIQATSAADDISMEFKGDKPRKLAISSDDFAMTAGDPDSILAPNPAWVRVALKDTGVTAGQYSAVNVDAKGRVTAGGLSQEFGTAGQTTPSANLMVNGTFWELVE